MMQTLRECFRESRSFGGNLLMWDGSSLRNQLHFLTAGFLAFLQGQGDMAAVSNLTYMIFEEEEDWVLKLSSFLGGSLGERPKADRSIFMRMRRGFQVKRRC